MNQTTIKESCQLSGGGLHTGQKITLHFHPAPANHGIVFFRSDRNLNIPATYRHAVPSLLCTTVARNGVRVSTVEHLLSVCNGLGIDNLTIELNGEEVPIMDGSGIAFFQKLRSAGLKRLGKPKKVIRILDTVSFRKDDITIFLTPSEHSSFTFSIDYEHDQIGLQEFTFHLTESNYGNQIVNAKTFCLERDVEKMKKQGLIKGGNKSNAIVLDEKGHFDNMETMTWLNEPNLHKILDLVGDFFLADNLKIIGNAFSHKSGHAANLEFVTYLMEKCRDKYAIVETD